MRKELRFSKNNLNYLINSNNEKYPELMISRKYIKDAPEIIAKIIIKIVFRLKWEYKSRVINNKIKNSRIGV